MSCEKLVGLSTVDLPESLVLIDNMQVVSFVCVREEYRVFMSAMLFFL